MTKTRWGPRKGEIDRCIVQVKNERFFVGVVSLLQVKLYGWRIECFVFYYTALRSRLNSKDGEILRGKTSLCDLLHGRQLSSDDWGSVRRPWWHL